MWYFPRIQITPQIDLVKRNYLSCRKEFLWVEVASSLPLVEQLRRFEITTKLWSKRNTTFLLGKHGSFTKLLNFKMNNE